MKMDFDKWKQEIDRIIESKVGLGVDDLPDMPFRDHFDDGMTPQQFVAEVVPEWVDGWVF